MEKCLWKFVHIQDFWYQSELRIFQHWLIFAIVYFGLIHIFGCKPLMVEDRMHSVEVSQNAKYLQISGVETK